MHFNDSVKNSKGKYDLRTYIERDTGKTAMTVGNNIGNTYHT